MTLSSDDVARAGYAALSLLGIEGRVCVHRVPPDPEGAPDVIVHAADMGTDHKSVTLTCPDSGIEIARVTP